MANNHTEIKVRGYHLDVYGHVNNARYLEFLEEARWEFLEDNIDLMEWRDKGRVFMIVNISINYRLAASIGDVLKIRTGITGFGHKSARLHQQICRKGSEEVIADADITFVIADMEKGKAVVFDGELKSAFEALPAL